LEGLKIIQIMQEMGNGISIYTVRKYINNFRKEGKIPPAKKITIEKVLELRKSGKSKHQIAQELGVSEGGVSGAIRRLQDSDLLPPSRPRDGEPSSYAPRKGFVFGDGI
jgi:transposase